MEMMNYDEGHLLSGMIEHDQVEKDTEGKTLKLRESEEFVVRRNLLSPQHQT